MITEADRQDLEQTLRTRGVPLSKEPTSSLPRTGRPPPGAVTQKLQASMLPSLRLDRTAAGTGEVAPPPEGDGQPDILLIRTLGEGGMGVVELALQPRLEREVAVKRLRHADQSAEEVQTLLREAVLTG